MLYMRARLLLKIFSRFGHWKDDRAALRDHGVVGLRGNQRPEVWDIHYQNFLSRGWGYLKAENFVHHCTDGPECPVAFAFSKNEAQRLFRKFHDVSFRVAHFPLRRYSAFFPFWLEKFVAEKFGWYLFIFATK